MGRLTQPVSGGNNSNRMLRVHTHHKHVMCEAWWQKLGYHIIAKVVLVPRVVGSGVLDDEELLVRIEQLTLVHPPPHNAEERVAHPLQRTAHERAHERVAVPHVCIQAHFGLISHRLP